MKRPSIAIIGSGAIGLYYGGKLAQAANDVRFLMRSDLDHARKHGIRIVHRAEGRALRSPQGEEGSVHTVHPVHAHATTPAIGPVDLVLVTFKTTSNPALPQLLPPLLHDSTLVATLQNGLGNEETIAAIVGNHRTLGGLCFIASTRTAPAEVTCYHPGSMVIGEFGRPAADRTRAIAAQFAAAGVKCTAVDDLSAARWKKLVWNIPFNGLSIAAGGITTDRILADPALAAEVRALMEEVAVAARHFGHEIPEKFIQGQIDVTVPMGPYKPSSLVDYLAGRAVEVESIWGEPLRRAQSAGVTMPRLESLYTRLRAMTPTVPPHRRG